MPHSSRPAFLAAVACVLAAALPAAAQNAPVAVTIGGAPVTFDQPPVERAGRVFVPLRGVFEKLGASVVYERGQINATKGATIIALSVGSTVALVNGQRQFLDNPPFLVGARVLVPLRFVSQALGAGVNFIRASRTVAITVPTGSGLPRHALGTSTGTTGPLTDLVPADNSTVSSHVAQVSAAFTRDVVPGTVRAALDGNDITPEIFLIQRKLVYYVTTPLTAGKHTLTVNATAAGGQAITGSWSFSTT